MHKCENASEQLSALKLELSECEKKIETLNQSNNSLMNEVHFINFEKYIIFILTI